MHICISHLTAAVLYLIFIFELMGLRHEIKV
ncbi:hypothetical protein F383_31522 [Gossypium arboreum]|uniref:Uncharacterized protein n=1 Tax=Gossypium arboreum TaxID=29729 RepID=A0A0B0MTI2_GOSAR|nr:hypothetical protein F383_31522 [Gossypium arboreum]